MGDNKSDSEAETVALMTVRLPQRLAFLPDEANWALDLKKLTREKTPPAWVRRVILKFLGVSPKDLKRPKKPITAVDLAESFGAASGIATGARVLFEHPIETSGFREEMKPVAIDFQRRMIDVMVPQTELVDSELAKLPKKFYKGTPETVRAYHKAESEGVEASSKPEDGTATNEVLLLLWVLWPEAQAAASVRELHAWLERMELHHGGLKNFEKVCTEVKYRGAPRRRRKGRRIPTKRP